MEESRVRSGSLKPKSTEPPKAEITSRLRGSLVRGASSSSLDEPLEKAARREIEVEIGMVIIQRDGGNSFRATEMYDTPNGNKVILEAITGRPVSLRRYKKDLEEKLNTPGSAWAIPKV